MSLNIGRLRRFRCLRCKKRIVETTERNRKYCDVCQVETGSTKAMRRERVGA